MSTKNNNENLVNNSIQSYRKSNSTRKVGRNERCTCGSGKKYKKCCMRKSIPKLSLIGFYYKSKDDDGFEISFNKYRDTGLFEMIESNFKIIQEQWDLQKNDMVSPIYSTSFEENMDSTIEFEITTMKEEISNWYKLNGFSDGLQPLGDSYVEWEISSRTQPTLMKILRSIYILTDVGVIKNDNYNGLNFMYTQLN